MQNVRRSSGRFPPAAPRYRGTLMGVAGCLLALPIAFAARSRAAPSATLVRATAESLVVNLPDRSRVVLEPGSALRYNVGVANRRAWMVGRARITIAPGAP